MLPAPICYDDVDEKLKRAWWNKLQGFHVHLTRFWHKINLPPPIWVLEEAPFNSAAGLPLSVSDGTCPDSHHRCRSGKYTLLLDVSDTVGDHYYDTQQVWFDNKPMINNQHVLFAGLEGLPPCSDMSLGGFIPPGAPCGVHVADQPARSRVRRVHRRDGLHVPERQLRLLLAEHHEAGRPCDVDSRHRPARRSGQSVPWHLAPRPAGNAL